MGKETGYFRLFVEPDKMTGRYVPPDTIVRNR